MIQLQILGGQKSGSFFVANKLPVQIGRGPSDDLRLEDDGVWEGHTKIELTVDGFIRLIPRQEAMVFLNGLRVTETLVKGGDVIDLGAAKMVFYLAPARHRGLVFREFVLWVFLFVLAMGELVLMFWLG